MAEVYDQESLLSIEAESRQLLQHSQFYRRSYRFLRSVMVTEALVIGLQAPLRPLGAAMLAGSCVAVNYLDTRANTFHQKADDSQRFIDMRSDAGQQG